MKIRTKMTILPVIVMLIPLICGIIYVRNTSRSYYEKQIGALHLTIAHEIVDDLEHSVHGRVEYLEGWITHSGLVPLLQAMDAPPPDRGAIKRLEIEWPRLSETDEPLRSILHNPMADILIQLQRINPIFAEVMLTDRLGRLVAATNPTTDYWQADETWWQDAAAQNPIHKGWSRHIAYDPSAGVQVIDITLPIHGSKGVLLGVLKGSLTASTVLQKLAPEPWNAEITRDILFHDGTLFARLNPYGADDRVFDRVSAHTMALLLAAEDTWKIVEFHPGEASLAACVPVGPSEGDGDQTIYVVAHRDYASAMAPVRMATRELTLRGALVVFCVAVVGFGVSTFWFARPLGKLRRAATSISEHVHQLEEGRIKEARDSLREVHLALGQLQSIRTRDELQDLAAVFAHMGGRVLHFHRQLERELTRKTEEINEDLAMAREFQEALLPHVYPHMSHPVGLGAFGLSFNHIYRPAQSVSGDFFDISEAADQRIRVVVADVMGHGARSALMTAILHALIYSAAKDDDDPAGLLQRMNGEFHDIGQRIGETIFVTAIHMIIDTHQRSVSYAVAGHPSPLVVDWASGEIKPLIPGGRKMAAAGLFADTVYTSAEHFIDREQTILLYTDGVTEAQNPQNEEFGEARLIQTVKDACTSGRQGAMPDYLLETLEAFMDTAPTMDDICLVSIDITKVQKR